MNPIETIVMFALDVEHDESTCVEVTYSDLRGAATAHFETRAEALAYAERISTHYGVEIEEQEPAS